MAAPDRARHRRLPAACAAACAGRGRAQAGRSSTDSASASSPTAGRRELSGGEQQRVGLARAMARRPALYLFDEPTAHLDAQVRDVFLVELAARRRESGAAAIYATHDAEEALGLADRVALLVGGRVIQVGTPQQVYDEPVDRAAARLTGPPRCCRTGRAGCSSGPTGFGSVATVRAWSSTSGFAVRTRTTLCRPLGFGPVAA